MTKKRLLLVEDDEDIRTQMKWALAGEYDVHLAGDRASAVSAFATHNPVVTLLDLGLPPRPNDATEGLAVLSELLARQPEAKVIVVSGQGEKQNALHAVGAGAYDFLCKPVDMDELRIVLDRCVYVAELEREYRALQRGRPATEFEGIIGASAPMQTLLTLVRKVAPTSAAVLILGESGTGKEMIARALHRHSLQKHGRFIPLNCSAIPESLIESELFGHEKGAFTGAHAQHKGHVESAAGGTLFLDEIGDLPLAVQVKLLRFLQDKQFQRVGGRQEIHSDARVIAATNANLQQAVAAGTFREDLYFRLAVVVSKVPALRERGDDVTLIATDFLNRFCAQHGKSRLTFAPEALRAIALHPWPGNVRELQNRVQRAVIMAEGKRITATDLELVEVAAANSSRTLKEAREEAERAVVGEALRRHNGKISAAALELGVSRPTLYELMERLGMGKDS